MAYVADSRAATPVNRLRELLDQAERELPSLRSDGLIAYLLQLDEMERLWSELAAEIVDLRAEESRWQDMQQRLMARAGQFVKLANQIGGMATLRAQHPPATGAWWHLDQHVAAQRRRQFRQLGITLAIVVVLAVTGGWLYNTFFAPSPEVLLAVNTSNRVEQLVSEQKWADALALVEQTLVTLPAESELLVWAGVLAERLGDDERARAYLAQAEAAIDAPVSYYTALGMRRFQAGDLDGAVAAAQAAQAVDPNAAQAYFLLGNVAEARGDGPAAIAFFEKTAALAEADDPQLTVIAKMRMGTLLQSLQFNPPAAPTEGSSTPADVPSAP